MNYDNIEATLREADGKAQLVIEVHNGQLVTTISDEFGDISGAQESNMLLLLQALEADCEEWLEDNTSL